MFLYKKSGLSGPFAPSSPIIQINKLNMLEGGGVGGGKKETRGVI